VDGIIAEYMADPERYGDFVTVAQRSLSRFGPAAFTGQVLARIAQTEAADVLL
jgi:hypothetical protein